MDWTARPPSHQITQMAVLRCVLRTGTASAHTLMVRPSLIYALQQECQVHHAQVFSGGNLYGHAHRWRSSVVPLCSR